MLAYFPKVYPGEMLYSVLARYDQHIGTPGPMHTLDALFGNRNVIATFDLPGHLQSLADRIPSERGFSVDHIIDTLTLFPYFTAFVPPAQQAKARDSMRRGAIDGLHVRLGLSAFRIGRNQWVRFCPECAEEMLAAHGELWWRRDHQLPGVLVCPKHACLLLESEVSFSQFSRHKFIAATSKNCLSHARPRFQLMDQTCLEHLQRIARRSADLLSNPPTGRTLASWTTFYRSRMLETGLSKSVATVDQHRFNNEFRKFYGQVLELLPSVMDGGNFAGNWLASIVRKHRKGNHPLYHVLVQDFLAQRELSTSLFGAGPWPCMNPLAKHGSHSPIKTFTQHGNHGNRVGVFSCTCGYAYTRCLDMKTSTLGLPRFLHYGPLLEPALRQLVMDGKGLREVGRSLQLDPKTVVRLAREFGIAVPWKSTSSDKRIQVSLQLAVKCELPFSSSTLAASKLRDSSRRPRCDWPEIDAAFLTKFNARVSTIHAETPPVRISVAELERRVNLRGWVLKRRYHLPLTMALLERVVETTDAFQLRRIHWAITELGRCGAQVKAWQVMRLAGLPSTSLSLIRAILETVPIPARLAA